MKSLTPLHLNFLKIIKRRPSTGGEIAEILKLPPQTRPSPRLRELVLAGLIESSGRQRTNKLSDRPAIVWAITKKGKAALRRANRKKPQQKQSHE